MPPIYLGSTAISKMYLGGTQLSAVYLGVQSLLSGSSTVLRAATLENRMYVSRTVVSAGFKGVSFFAHVISSADISAGGIYFMSQGWTLEAGAGQTNVPDWTIESMSAYKAGAGSTTPVTWDGGNTSKVIASGSEMVLSDLWTIAADSKVGDVIWTKCRYVQGAGATGTPGCHRTPADRSTQQYGWYDPAVTTIVNDTGVTGPFTATGTALNTNGSLLPFVPMVLTYHPSSVYVRGLVGDSIGMGQADTAGNTGRGFALRGCYDAGSSAVAPINPIASINVATPGITAALIVASSKVKNLYSLAMDWMWEPGTNDFGSAGTGVLATIQANELTGIADLYANGARKVFVSGLLPRAQTGNAIPALDWGAGGKVDQFRSWRLSNAGTVYSAYFESLSVRLDPNPANANFWLWAASQSTDLLHPLAAGYLNVTTDYRPLWISNGSTHA